MNGRVISFLEQSFLAPLLHDEAITDITFNGRHLHYVHNSLGRRRHLPAPAPDEVMSFIRQIANLTEQHFSYTHPILDVSVGHYRLNAVGPSIARIDYDKTVTFSLRIGHTNKSKIEIRFQPEPVLDSLFRHLVGHGVSIVIGGKTGSGKTEFQKYLISIMPAYARIIVIDNVLELEAINHETPLDVTIWQVNTAITQGDFASLIENGLRSHPDWVIVAEARGGEMKEALTAAMTGHPIITTVHSLDVTTLPARMARMVIASQPSLRYAETLADIKDHFPILVYLRKREDDAGVTVREIHQIAEMRSSTQKVKIIYEYDGREAKFRKISSKLRKKLGNDVTDIRPFTNKEGTNDE